MSAAAFRSVARQNDRKRAFHKRHPNHKVSGGPAKKRFFKCKSLKKEHREYSYGQKQGTPYGRLIIDALVFVSAGLFILFGLCFFATSAHNNGPYPVQFNILTCFLVLLTAFPVAVISVIDFFHSLRKS